MMYGLAEDLAAVGFDKLAARARGAAAQADRASEDLNKAIGGLVSGFVRDSEQSSRNLFAGLAAGAALATGDKNLADISKAIKGPRYDPGPDPSENCPDCKSGKPCYGHNHR